MLYSQLRSFHAVAKEGGFTAASRAIHIGQSTISTQIKALENTYGITLFHRPGRKIQISDCGEALFKISQRILQLEEEARDLLNNYGGILTGDLRIGAVGPYHATDMLAKFNQKHPGINLTVKLGNSMEMVDLLMSYSVDVAVLAHTEDNPAIYARPFSRHSVIVFVNTSHPFAKRKHIRLEELQGQRFVYREVGSTTRRAFEKALKSAGVTVDPVMEVGSRESVWLAVERGIGIGVVSDVEFNPHPNLRTLKISDAEIFTTAHITCLSDRVESKLVKTFFEIAESIPESQRVSS
jgi:aminoethylphosphonate catabolism LysR family transcriptional regulator